MKTDGLPRPCPELRLATEIPLNTALPPAWRWERAKMLRAEGRTVRKGREDEWVALAVRFQNRLAAAESKAAQQRLACEMPAVFWAWYWHAQEEEYKKNPCWTVEAYLCAAETPEGICNRVDFHPDVVKCYARLFFDVVGKTKHKMYMLNEVLGRSVHRGLSSREYDLLWKLYGLLRGPSALDSLVYGAVGDARPDGASEVRVNANFDVRDAMAAKAWVAARTMPVEYNQEIILAHFCKLREIEEREKDAGTATNLILNNINAMLQGSGGFSFGGRPEHGDPALRAFDDAESELRASEQVTLALGDTPNVARMKFPEAKDGRS